MSGSGTVDGAKRTVSKRVEPKEAEPRRANPTPHKGANPTPHSPDEFNPGLEEQALERVEALRRLLGLPD